MPLIEYLKEVLGEQISISAYEKLNKLPLYLMNAYEFSQTRMHDIECILLESKTERILTDKIQKHILKLRELGNEKPVLVFENLRLSQRKKLVEARIPFIVPNRQIYLPFICLDFMETRVLEVQKINKFTAMTQQLFIYLLNLKHSEVQTKLVSENLNMAYATANRSIRQLVEVGLILESGTATRKRYHRLDRKDLWNKGKAYLINPVASELFLCEVPNNLEVYLSGDSALSEMTMLIEPASKVYAINKTNMKSIDKELIKSQYDLDECNYVKLQVWKYNPGTFAVGNKVDPFSLYAMYLEDADPRIEIELEALIEEVL